VLLAGLFPWSGLLLPGVALVSRRRPADLYLALWILLPLAFFSFAGSKLPGYILPVVPPLAILMGRGAQALAGERPLPAGTGRTAVAVLGLVLGLVVAAVPLLLSRAGDAVWPLTIPAAAWSGLLMWGVFRGLHRSAAGALGLLRVGAAGLALLVAMAAPSILARRESGRDLFRAAAGREVLVWGAGRTAWMAGYFYNDARVRVSRGPAEILEAARLRPTLVLCGSSERRQLEATRGLDVRPLAVGPQRAWLVEVSAR
jgi:4-amino-4-deoxy-L-arabinose transferase-like glycosyltransferase